MRAWSLALVLATGCATAAGNDAAGALANVAIASAVGGVRVHEGDCFTVCAPGTVCNSRTKLCDPLPCHGQCGARESCDASGPIDHCVSQPALAVGKQSAPPAEAIPVNLAAPISSAPPSAPGHLDVPAASP
jgi:hypothetical protein